MHACNIGQILTRGPRHTRAAEIVVRCLRWDRTSTELLELRNGRNLAVDVDEVWAPGRERILLAAIRGAKSGAESTSFGSFPQAI
mmetsp:Transcript_479/g.1664  ORF Transcript_479/g.1664 Transcript_479/m.1664 type:complete len:85 (-) Transcript_479:1276-1530(-)